MFYYLKQEVDLFTRGPDQSVKPFPPLVPLLQAEQRVFFPIFSVKHGASPRPHAFLDLLHIVLGPL